ncbi:MFS transporter, partial [Patescibacteria group bacterium]|nr:MFS transporter [Patescibacteria group bacterium]
METPKQIIRSYMTISGLFTLSASLIWGINTLFLLDAGLDIFQTFIANAIFTAAMALFEIPTGVLADTRGRRVSFLLSVIIIMIGTLGYVGVSWFDGGLLWFGVMSVVLGLGYTFYSGAVEAWVVDALKEAKYEGILDTVFARSARISGIAMLIGTVGGGLLGSIDLAWPFIARALLLAALFIFSFSFMKDHGFSPRTLELSRIPEEMKKVAKESLKFGWRVKPVRLLMMVSFLQAGFMFWAFYAWQPYFLELLGQNLIWVAGLIAALISVSTIIGNTLVQKFTKYGGRRTTFLLWSSVVFTVTSILVGIVGNFWLAVPLFLLGTTTMGIVGPIKQGYLHKIIPSKQRASVISFDAMVGSGGSVVGQTGLGYLSKTQSIGDGFIVGGISTALVFPILYAVRKLGGEADKIETKQHEKPDAAAGEGTTGVSSEDTSSKKIADLSLSD